ncbi:MAG: DUF2283 domain-containing protein [Patescibacteria group bacterium]
MDIRYDTAANAVYLRINDGAVAQTVRMNERLLVDVDVQGNTLGFEILDASSQKDLIRSLEENVASGVPVSIS